MSETISNRSQNYSKFNNQIAQKVHEKWHFKDQFVIEQLHFALDVDSSENSVPMNHDVSSPNEIRSKFDGISYNKGASIIRMFEHTFGYATFIAAIQKYLKIK